MKYSLPVAVVPGMSEVTMRGIRLMVSRVRTGSPILADKELSLSRQSPRLKTLLEKVRGNLGIPHGPYPGRCNSGVQKQIVTRIHLCSP